MHTGKQANTNLTDADTTGFGAIGEPQGIDRMIDSAMQAAYEMGHSDAFPNDGGDRIHLVKQVASYVRKSIWAALYEAERRGRAIGRLEEVDLKGLPRASEDERWRIVDICNDAAAEYCELLGQPFRVEGSGICADIFMEVAGGYEIEVMNYVIHVNDGSNVVQVNLWHFPDPGDRLRGTQVVRVNWVPNDPGAVHDVARRLISARDALGTRPFAIDCFHSRLDEALAPYEAE